MSWNGPSISRIQRSLEEQSCRSPSREKLQRSRCHQRRADRIRVEHFPRIHHVAQLYGKVTDLLSKSGETPEISTRRILFMSMFNDISCDKKDNKEECLTNAEVVPISEQKFGIGQWSFIGGIWDHNAEKILVEFVESGCPIFRATIPLSRGEVKSKGHGKLSIHY